MKYAIISRHAPYASSHNIEALELTLAAGSFGFEVGYFFSDDGVYQLTAQAPHLIEQKNHNKTLKALPFYDVENIYALSSSLETRNIDSADLTIPVKVVAFEEWQSLLNAYHRIIGF